MRRRDPSDTSEGKTKTVLDVRFKLPANVFEKAFQGVPTASMSVSIRDGSDSEVIHRPIPLVAKSLKVEFFPEGGEMVAGVPGRVYFMVRTPAGKSADIKGYVTDGAKRIEVATVTDAENPGVNRGHGVFALTGRLESYDFTAFGGRFMRSSSLFLSGRLNRDMRWIMAM